MENDNNIYGERIGYTPPVRVIFTVSCLVCFAVCIFVPLAVGNQMPNAVVRLTLQVVFSIIGVLLILVLIDFWWLDFLITETDVIFGFGVIRKVIPRSEILSCEPYEIRFRNYLGYGIRWVFTFDGTIGYIARSGKGVKMIVDGCKKPYVVSVDKPERVCELLSR